MTNPPELNKVHMGAKVIDIEPITNNCSGAIVFENPDGTKVTLNVTLVGDGSMMQAFWVASLE